MADPADPIGSRASRRPGVPRRPARELGPRPTSPREVDAASQPPPRERSPTVMILVRYVLPAGVIVAGLIAMAFGTDVSLEGGAGLIGAGLAIWFINWLFRIGASGDAEREAEDRAREYFDRHGHWPEGR